MYDWLKLIHVLAVIVWVGGGILVLTLTPRLMNTGDRATQLAVAKANIANGRVFAISAVVALIAGTWMVLDNDVIEFSQAWITIGFLGIAVGAVLGSAFYGPTGRKLVAAIESGDGGTAAAIGQRIGMVSLAEVIVLLVVVWSMVFKPGL